MAVAIIDGPLGLEATWTLRGVILNRPGTFPFYEFTKVVGLHDKAVSDLPFDPKPGRAGIVPRRSQLREKNVTCSIQIQDLGLQALRRAVTALRVACSDETATSVHVQPHAAWGSIGLDLLGQPAAFTCDDDQQSGIGAVPSAYQRAAVLTFRMSDPRAWASADTVTGGAADGVGAAITAGGLAPSEPVVSFAVPGVGNIDLENVTQGKVLRFVGMPGGGGAVVVDFLARTALQGGVDVRGYIDWSVSTWWRSTAYGVAPTTETLKVTGGGAWTVAATPAVF